MREWLKQSAAVLGDGIGAGRIDPVALTEVYLDAIAAHPLRDRIYARVTADRAMAEAGAAAKRAWTGRRLSPLDGVPVSWKDLFDTAGIGTEAGTAMLAGRVPTRDAEVLRVATSAGLVCLGKTHMSEIAFSGLGYNPITATPPCVNDADAVPGGSSSGAAASVAFGLAAAAIGSDTGGSVRIPSAWNDLVGFKPAHGALSLDGVVPLCKSFDTIGPLCRSVADAGLLYAALSGGVAPDLTGVDLRGARLLVVDTVVMEDLHAVPGQAFVDTVERLKAAGAEVFHADIPEVTEAYGLSAALYTAEAYAWWREHVEAAPEKMFVQILNRVRAGRDIAAHDFIAGWERLREIRQRFAALTAGYDAVICPSAALLPPKVADLIADDATYKAANLLTLRNTRLANLMGLASVSLPVGTPSCGILLNMPAGQEGRLLRLAAGMEMALAQKPQ